MALTSLPEKEKGGKKDKKRRRDSDKRASEKLLANNHKSKVGRALSSSYCKQSESCVNIDL